MKNLIMPLLVAIAFFECNGQNYEVWVKTTGFHNFVRGNLRHFNDSVLIIVGKQKAFPSYLQKELNFKWDDIYALKIRNEKIHGAGIAIGAGVGIIASLLINKSIKENTENIITGTFGLIFADIGVIGAGTLAGHLFTSAKIVIPLNGKSAKEKSQALKSRINK